MHGNTKVKFNEWIDCLSAPLTFWLVTRFYGKEIFR